MFIPPTKPVILVTGSNGQLGREFRYWASNQETYEFLFTSRDSMDVTNLAEVLTIFSKWQPNFCINCAAYTAVDKAEEETELAYAINRDAISNLTKACTETNCILINYSTDYVYDSITGIPILESAPCTPKSVYGQSKRAGETILENSNIKWLNIRVSWLYSSYQNNFVKTMVRLGATKDSLSIVGDQIGTPTYARDLANATMNIIASLQNEEKGLQEHYNYSNHDQTNWADFARLIFQISHSKCIVSNITTEAYGAPAPRPLWSVLNKDKITSTFSLEIPSYEDSLSDCLNILLSQDA